jgi:phosphoglycolate phosphatase
MSAFPFDVVVFDLDGTLADTAADIAAAINHALGTVGRPPLPVEQVRGLIGEGARELLRKCMATSGDASEELLDRAFPHQLDFYAANVCNGTIAYAEAEAAMDELAALGVRLAICTNKPERITHLLIEALGWEQRFAAIVGGDSLPARKPDPAPLLEAVARAGGGRAVYVGDSIVDARTARAAGIPFVAVGFGFADRPVEQLGADVVIHKFGELVPALTRMGRTRLDIPA